MAEGSRVAKGEAVEDGRRAGATGGGAAAALNMLARAVIGAVGLVVLLFVVAVLLVILHVYSGGSIVSGIEDAARVVAGPFNGVSTLSALGARYAINWGIAGVVYVIVAMIVAAGLRSLAARMGAGAGQHRRGT